MEWKKISSVKREKYKGEVYDIELKDNHYFAANNIISHNCRLLNDMELLDLGSQVNSFGGGGSISMGSHRVITLSFCKYAIMAKSMKDFYKILDEEILNAAKILKAHKVLLGKLEQQGLEPFISNGFIRMDRLMSTYGILGVVEASIILKERFGDELEDGQDVMKDMLTYLNVKSKEYGKEYNIKVNHEQIPGESFAVRLATVDKLLFADEDGYITFDDGKDEVEEKIIYTELEN